MKIENLLVYKESITSSLSAFASTFLLSPLEIIRINAVSANPKEESKSKGINNHVNTRLDKLRQLFIDAIKISFLIDIKSSLLRASHSSAGSFLYFLFYKLLLKYFRLKFQITSPERNLKISLVASNLSSIISVILTSPLDRYVYQNQKDVKSSNPIPMQKQNNNHINLSKHYEGLIPSLLLCIHPTIYYSLYDRIKFEFVHSRNEKYLSSSEAFATSLVAKLIASFITYPLVKVKLLIMKDRENYNQEENELKRMIKMLLKIVSNEGIVGVFKGFFEHTSYAALRSTISMVNEYIYFSYFKLILCLNIYFISF